MAIDYTKTEIHLLNVPLDMENNHTYYFASVEEQFSFFYAKRKHSALNCTYQRKDSVIRFPRVIDDINNCNYVMYRNLTHKDKWYYAFIKNMTFMGEELTNIEILTDPLQTYLFDYTIGQCFVEREHVDLDTPGLHTIPENLETGEYVGDYISVSGGDTSWLTYGVSNCCSVVAVSDRLNKFPVSPSVYNQADIPTGLTYIGCLTNQCVRNLIEYYDSKGKGEAIQYIFIAPKHFFGTTFEQIELNYDSGAVGFGTYGYLESFEKASSCNFQKPTKLAQGYSPRNNKLLSYPYSYLTTSNNAGTIVPYTWEDFNNPDDKDKVQFRCIEGMAVGGSIKVYPQFYKGKEANFDEGISYGKLPIGSWTSDVYTNWLTQNSVNVGISLGTALGSILGAVVMGTMGNALGAGLLAVNGISGVGQSLGQLYEHSLIPDQAKGNVNVGDVNYQFSLTGIKFSHMSIKSEYAKVIDRYFDMYGYKVNSLKVPNKNHRESYWYTKTIDANITGAIPMNDRQRIIECYNKGITFWRPDRAFRNYTQDNLIV